MFGKIITAMVTPFDTDNNINLDSLKTLVEHLIKNNTTTIILSSTTGEAPTLSDVEKMVLFEKTLQYVNKRIKVIGGIGSDSTEKTIDFMKKIEHLSLDGYLLVVPSINRPDQDGLYQHFEKIALATKKPILIENVQEKHGVGLDIPTIKQLAKINNIVGIIEKTHKLEKVQRIKKEIKKLYVYLGNDLLLYDGLRSQVDGIYSIGSHIYGKTIHHINQLIRTKQYDDALAIFNIYKPKFRALSMKPNPVCLKVALNKLGINVGKVRLPLVDMNEQLKQKLYNILGI